MKLVEAQRVASEREIVDASQFAKIHGITLDEGRMADDRSASITATNDRTDEGVVAKGALPHNSVITWSSLCPGAQI